MLQNAEYCTLPLDKNVKFWQLFWAGISYKFQQNANYLYLRENTCEMWIKIVIKQKKQKKQNKTNKTKKKKKVEC